MQRLRLPFPQRVIRVIVLSFTCGVLAGGCGTGSVPDGSQVATDPKEAERHKQMQDFMTSKGKPNNTKARRR